MYPKYLYHQTLAPTGRLFTDEAELEALNDEWVDTPAKFQIVWADAAQAESAHDDTALARPPQKRGWRPRKEQN